MSEERRSTRGDRIVTALNRFADDLEAGARIGPKDTVRQVRVIPSPRAYTPAEVRGVRERIGASQEVFAQLLAVSPMTVRSWEQGTRSPSPMARRFLDEIAMAPEHFRGRIVAAAGGGPSGRRATSSGERRRGRPPS